MKCGLSDVLRELIWWRLCGCQSEICRLHDCNYISWLVMQMVAIMVPCCKMMSSGFLLYIGSCMSWIDWNVDIIGRICKAGWELETVSNVCCVWKRCILLMFDLFEMHPDKVVVVKGGMTVVWLKVTLYVVLLLLMSGTLHSFRLCVKCESLSQ